MKRFENLVIKMPEWNKMEDFKNGMEDDLSYLQLISQQILLMAFTEKYIRILITENMWKRLAVICHQINRVIRL